ncbi:hypothetical protein OSB04_031933 [Centaurea solstitialis]|uniref:Protein ABIL1 n=1 Tax=Centaurea solstitialis TaxID=347529 RepID=A0AA38SN28_9ASTR|nr:hypothetical protein OSB04_031933 [Centaurea solstitialis]
MEVEQSMEQSIGFVKALQELKNLRPQLYSAAEYCEKSYLHSEQKQVVLDNLKDYAVRALVNAVDHLGTVAYKFTDVLDQQALEISTTGLHVTCLHQKQLLTCQTYTDREALRQQQLLAVVPRHHKHYSLPNLNSGLPFKQNAGLEHNPIPDPTKSHQIQQTKYSVGKKVHFSPQIQTGAKQTHLQSRARQFSSGTPAANTLCWHLASETKSTLKGNSRPMRLRKTFPLSGSLQNLALYMSVDDPKTSGRAPSSSNASNGDDGMRTKSAESHLQMRNMGPASTAAIRTLGITQQDSFEGPKPMMPFRSFDNPGREIPHVPLRSKSVLSAFFVKQKTPKLRTSAVS